MRDGKLIGLGGVGLLSVLCCSGPSLLVAIGSLGVSAWFPAAGYVPIPIGLVAVGAAAFYLYRPCVTGSTADAACCGSPSENKEKLNV